MNYANYTHLFFHPTLNIEFDTEALYFLFKQMREEGMKSYENVYVMSVLSPNNVCLVTRVKHNHGCLNTYTSRSVITILFSLFHKSVPGQTYDFYTYEDKKMTRHTVQPDFTLASYEDVYVIRTMTLLYRPNQGVLRISV